MMELDPTFLARSWTWSFNQKSAKVATKAESRDTSLMKQEISEAELPVISKKHQKTIEESLAAFKKIRFVGAALIFDFIVRTNLFVLYAQTFDDCPNTTAIGVIVYLSYVATGLLSLFSGFIGDYWRFDYLLVIAAILDVITFWLEASAPNFKVLAIAYVVGGQPIQSIITGYFTKLLPPHYSKQFNNEFLRAYVLGGLIAPALGGVIAWSLDIKAVFIMSGIVSLCLFFYIAHFVALHDKLAANQLYFREVYSQYKSDAGNMERIIAKQIETDCEETSQQNDHYYSNVDSNALDDSLSISIFTNNNNNSSSNGSGSDSSDISLDSEEIIAMKWLISDDYRFPVCYKYEKNGNKSKQQQQKVSGYRFFLVTVIIIQQAITLSSEAAMGTWLLPYMMERFNSGVLFAACLLSFGSFWFIIASGVVERVLKNKRNKSQLQQKQSSARMAAAIAAQTQALNSNGSGSNGSASNSIGARVGVTANASGMTVSRVAPTAETSLTGAQRRGRRSKFSNKMGRRAFDFTHYLVITIILSAVLRGLTCMFVVPDNMFAVRGSGGSSSNDNSFEFTFWFYMVIINILWALMLVCNSVLLMEILPRNLSSRVFGFRQFLNYCVKALGAIIVGVLWNYSMEWLWYTMAGFDAAVVVIMCFVAVIESCGWN